MLTLPVPDLLRRDAVRERAAGSGIRNQDRSFWTKDLGSFRHEVDAREHDYTRGAGGGEAGQRERVAHVIGGLLDLGSLVVVGEDHRVALGGEPPDPRHPVCIDVHSLRL